MSWSVPWVASVVKTEPKKAAQIVYSCERIHFRSVDFRFSKKDFCESAPLLTKAGCLIDSKKPAQPQVWPSSQKNT